MEKHLLFVEDDAVLNEVFSRLLEKNGFIVDACLDGKTALKITESERYDAALVDVNLGDVSGFEILRSIKTHRPHIPVIMITAYSNVNDAVKAMKEGAYDYITKPIKEKEIVLMLNNAIASSHPERSLPKETTAASALHDHIEIIGGSVEITNLKETIRKVASASINVFISGETGTGKELIARMIHSESEHSDRPFVAINCAAIPEALFESELFGHAKGAFTGAESDKKGKFEFAGFGSIFLDEISEMPQSLQAKLLRVVQEKEIEPLGTNKKIKMNARIIAASNRNITDEIARGRFREDLYYRLSAMPISVAPLRERRNDIPVLIQHFVKIFNLQYITVDPDAIEKMMEYHWPGNVRELQNALQYAAISCRDGRILLENLPDKIVHYVRNDNSGNDSRAPLQGTGVTMLTDQDRTKIIDALKKNSGNQSVTAKNLGISRAQLLYRMKKLNIIYNLDIR